MVNQPNRWLSEQVSQGNSQPAGCHARGRERGADARVTIRVLGCGVETHLVREHQQRVLGVEEGLVAQQDGRAPAVAAAVALQVGAGVHERVVHRGVVVRAAGPAPVALQAALRRLPVQVPGRGVRAARSGAVGSLLNDLCLHVILPGRHAQHLNGTYPSKCSVFEMLCESCTCSLAGCDVRRLCSGQA